MRSLSIAATGMLAQQLNVEVISNNIANMNTTAYKRQRAEFQDLLYQSERRVGSQAADNNSIVPAGVELGLGVKTAAVYRITEQGNLTTTGNQLDLAIQGKGYFQVTLPDNTIAYTRAGSFQLDQNGNIVTADGLKITGANAIPSNATSITINQSGQIFVSQQGQTQLAAAGQFSLVSFINDTGLQPLGNNMFIQTQASGNPTIGTAGNQGFGTILQGFLESSNVNTVQEITNLISAQRAYEMNSKVIQASDEMLQTLNNTH
ncbi:MAG TPA: flagellar basal-body rod protein FlgG [Alphaproteobacteria bacterium]|jgi:flagellar basal-body rod protein FlgG|nr:flagellar basal-body rod protein FlgG [Alphaproteobacteria bacterium]